MQELLDVFDSKMNLIGTAERKEVHKMGYWHQTFHCWIIREENGKHYVLFQIRDKNKDVAPNKLDITAAGHLKSGESKQDGVREINEELGLDIKYEDLTYLGIRITASENTNQINKEFAHVFLLKDNTPLNDYSFNDGEVAGLVEIEIADGLNLCSQKKKNIPCRVFRNNQIREENITFEQFIPRIDSYYYKVFIMAERYFQGNEFLSI